MISLDIEDGLPAVRTIYNVLNNVEDSVVHELYGLRVAGFVRLAFAFSLRSP